MNEQQTFGREHSGEERLADVESERPARGCCLTTARAFGSRHWNAVYDAMRRAEAIDPETSS